MLMRLGIDFPLTFQETVSVGDRSETRLLRAGHASPEFEESECQ